ncbi:helix-turn-helix transcriptional regulator [Thalassospira alkalitolerans]|uniref:helix-turn-helix domain-containing protein n=1 Tax=Thalassospira alkalitolerans TaxID=1293890 RepID=UPI0030EE9942|tara:strand:+ start:1950 stop:2186 length:237 start_codon:yes stop_codon:yes gene_type:complete
MEKAELHSFRKQFGKRVRELRKARGYSQEAFAHECDIHRTYMGDVERGERNIALDNIVKIANALDIELSELFLGISRK